MVPEKLVDLLMVETDVPYLDDMNAVITVTDM